MKQTIESGFDDPTVGPVPLHDPQGHLTPGAAAIEVSDDSGYETIARWLNEGAVITCAFPGSVTIRRDGVFGVRVKFPDPAPTQEEPPRWTPAEREAIDRLKAEKDMSEPAIIRQALRMYQAEHERLMGRAGDPTA